MVVAGYMALEQDHLGVVILLHQRIEIKSSRYTHCLEIFGRSTQIIISPLAIFLHRCHCQIAVLFYSSEKCYWLRLVEPVSQME